MPLKMTYGTRICITCPAVIRATPSAKRCKECDKQLIREITKLRRIKNLDLGLCPCGRPRFEDYYNCENCLTRNRNNLKTGRYAENRNRYLAELKNDAYSAYGNACSCCPEHRLSLLEFDHIGGWGKEHKGSTGNRISGYALYIWLRSNNYPSTIRLLCGSCHISITRNGICEHETEALDFILANCRRD